MKKNVHFWQGKKEKKVELISDVGICAIYLSMTLGTSKFKQLDLSCYFRKFSFVKNPFPHVANRRQISR